MNIFVIISENPWFFLLLYVLFQAYEYYRVEAEKSQPKKPQIDPNIYDVLVG